MKLFACLIFLILIFSGCAQKPIEIEPRFTVSELINLSHGEYAKVKELNKDQSYKRIVIDSCSEAKRVDEYSWLVTLGDC